MTAKLTPSQIVVALKHIAQDCEKGERNPITGISTWPKETTIEWQAAELIQELLEALKKGNDGKIPS